MINAVVDPKKPTGEDWDEPSEEQGINVGAWDSTLGTAAARYYAPGSGFIVGRVLRAVTSAESSKSSPAPDIAIRFSAGQKRRMTPIYPNSSVPTWEHSMLLRFADEEHVTITVVDVDPGGSAHFEPVGTVTVPSAKLCDANLHSFTGFGAVKELHLKTRRYGASFGVDKNDIAVPAGKPWTSTGIDVIDGQELEITAAGRACASGTQCAGPSGFPLPRWREHNVLSDAPHCGLLLRIGDGPKVRRS